MNGMIEIMFFEINKKKKKKYIPPTMSDNVLTCCKEVLGKNSPIKKHLTFDEVITKD